MARKQHTAYLEKTTVRAVLLAASTVVSARLLLYFTEGGTPTLFAASLVVFMTALVLFYTVMIVRITMLQKRQQGGVILPHMYTFEDELRGMDIAHKFVLVVAAFLFFWFSVAYELSELTALASLGVILIFSIIPFSIIGTKYVSLKLAERFRALGLTCRQSIDAHVLGDVTYILLGDASLMRGSVRDVEYLRSCGIHVRFVTEESATAALKTARALGVAGMYDVALTGKDIIGLSDHELYMVLKTVHVFARIIPRHQERIARVLRKYGETLMTYGDDKGSMALLHRGDIKVCTTTGDATATEEADIRIEGPSLGTLRGAVTAARDAVHARYRSGVFMLFSTIVALILVSFLLTLGERALVYIPLIVSAILVGYLCTIGSVRTVSSE